MCSPWPCCPKGVPSLPPGVLRLARQLLTGLRTLTGPDMVSHILCVVLYRLVLPLALLSAVLFRQNVFSLVYLMLLLLGPLLPSATAASISGGHAGRYLRAALCSSILLCLAQITFQITLLSLGNYGSFIEYCSWQGKLFSLFGLHRLDGVSVEEGLRLVGLDLVVMFTSVLVYVACSKLTTVDHTAALSASTNATAFPEHIPEPSSTSFIENHPLAETMHSSSVEPIPSIQPENCPQRRKRRKRLNAAFILFGELLILVLMAGAGILAPSLLSSIYFLLFLIIATWLACNRQLGRRYLLSRIGLMAYCALHFIAVFSYQTVYAQELLPPDTLYARLLGFTALTNATCENARSMDFLPLSWTFYVSPLLVLALYWLLATATRCRIFYAKKDNKEEEGERLSDITSGSGGVASLYLHGGSKHGSQRSSTSLIRRRKSLRRAKSECMSIRQIRAGYGEFFPLLEDDRNSRFYRTLDVPMPRGQRRSLAPDLNGSMVWSSEGDFQEEGPMSPTVANNHQRLHRHRVLHDSPTVPAKTKTGAKGAPLIAPLVALMKLLARGSYVCTLIIMMTWSITYHSWLTFVLLLWSCVLWMTPNSRRACLRSSPFLVAYAEALLLLQYLYGLDLSDQELPRQIETVNLAQIGLVKYYGLSYQPLAVKILYTLLFWLTLHQYIQEKQQSSQRDLSHELLLEPFHISFSTTQPGNSRPEVVPRRQPSDASAAIATGPEPSPSRNRVSAVSSGSPLIRHLTALIKVLLTKYWIWAVACMLMVISLGGEKVVLYRVAYMFLFLFFISMFQFSYRLWRRVMYGFWLTMIVYSMLVLILIYTYQFESFPDYWRMYLGVPDDIQRDIGLEVYKADPGTLFLKLLTPTFFLIITIIQLHYFHKEFLRISDINYRPDEEAPLTPPAAAVATEPTVPFRKKESVVPPLSRQDSKVQSPTCTDKKPPRTELQELLRQKWEEGVVLFYKLCELLWRLLEIHIGKIVLFSVLALTTNDVCAIHFVFMLLVVLALPLAGIQRLLLHGCSLWASVLLLSKMIYQLSFVDSYGWAVNCTSGIYGNESMLPYPLNGTIDNRIWIGFQKTDNLTDYCKGYIGLIIVLTIQAVVHIRQQFHRFHSHEPVPPQGVVFEDVTRTQADEGILPCAKFLLNYFFYKFGVEWCFVTIVACIGIRLDVFAVLNALWLCIMVLMPRRLLSKLWPFYVVYQCIVLPIQYLMCVGIPPGICIDYPWTEPLSEELREWLYLPNLFNPPNAYKILVDFFQLIFSCCQLYVFSVENGPDAETYAGGTNSEMYHATDRNPVTKDNPVPDFVTKNQSYLDMAKSILFFGFYWVTLAIVFLAGTSRVSLFAMGYVIGCFVFLWSGNEFYLKPIRNLLKMWNGLLAYNVAVILIKCILQVLGCVFFNTLYRDVCPLAQLLGMACLKKLTVGTIAERQESWCCMKSILRCGVPGFSCSDLSEASTYDPVLNGDCRVPSDEAGLMWDGVCFAFLLLQKRLFCSNYFMHLVQEIRAQQMLASRGAEMIQEIQQREVKEQEAGEQDVMLKIKKKMDRIRARHQKTGPGGGGEGAGDSSSSEQQATHFQAIRSGDYYMFDEYTDEELDLELRGGRAGAAKQQTTESEDEESAEVKEKGINALLSQAMKGTLPATAPCPARARKGSEEEVDDVGESSHMSPIVSADRSPLTRTLSGASTSQARPPLSRITTLSPYEGETPRGESEITPPSLPAYEPSVFEEQPKEIGEAEEPPEVSWLEKVKGWIAFLKVFLESCLISATAKLNAISKDYRYVARQLAAEKMLLKEQFTTQSHTPTSMQKQPVIKALIKEETKVSITLQKGSQDLAESIELLDTPDGEKGLQDPGGKGSPVMVRFLVAIYYAVVSRSELLCYIMIIVNQMKYASFLSLPLPLMAFLWGSLSVPRPSKTFWISIITYTEAIIVIKCLFQFDFYPWNKQSKVEPFKSPFVIGIEQMNYGFNSDKARNYFVVYDLALLMVVFFHRFMLKSLGLWKDTSAPAPTFQSSTDESPTSRDKTDMDKESLIVGLKDIELSTEIVRKKDDEEKEGSVRSLRSREGSEERDGSLDEDSLLEDEDDALCESDQIEGPSTLDVIWKQMLHYTEPVRAFFRNLLYPEYRVTVDVYAFMFFCDFINFLIIVFGYSAFGTSTGGDESGVASYFQDNKVPIPFLIMLIAQFALIVIDRALYLRKHIFGKMIFQIALVFIIHIWMFFILPIVMEIPFASSRLQPKLWYFIKCVYLLLSSYQIRSGYPTRILGNFFCKKYNYINLYLFKSYQIIPFLYELRCLMDWMWTDTSMNIGNWLKMEDIFANIFVLKCNRRAEEEYPTPSGSKRTWLVKYGVGGALLFLLILIIWFPLLLFALGNTVGLPNTPSEFSVMLTIGSYEPVFKMSVQNGSYLRQIKPGEWTDTINSVGPRGQKFLRGYDEVDVTVVSLNSNSTSTWAVSPPSQTAMVTDLMGSGGMNVKFSWSLFRNPNSTGVDKLVVHEQVIDLNMDARTSLAHMLNGTADDENGVRIQKIFPNYLKASARAITAQDFTGTNSGFRDLEIRLRHGPLGNSSSDLQWWEVRDPICQSSPTYKLKDQNCNLLQLLIMSDKVFPSELSIFSGYGIVGLYTTFVLLVSRLVRGFVAGMSFTIMFDDMPYVNRILQLCLDIYLVRESGEFNLEEDLFAKLIFLYRSPETLIKWTRYPDNYFEQLQQQQQQQNQQNQQQGANR